MAVVALLHLATTAGAGGGGDESRNFQVIFGDVVRGTFHLVPFVLVALFNARPLLIE